MQLNLPKNLSIYWGLSTILAFWFLFIHAPPILVREKAYKNAPFLLHLVGVYTIYLGCVFNALMTPTTLNGKARPYHIWVGRAAMIGGIIGFCAGAFSAWYPYQTIRPSLTFSILITLGGVAQIISQYLGYTAIKKFQALKKKIEELESDSLTSGKPIVMEELDILKEKKQAALKRHIYFMIALFAAACGIPASIRLAELFGKSTAFLVIVIILILVLNVMIRPFAGFYYKKMPVPGSETDPLTTK